MTTPVLLVTCAAFPEGDPGEPGLLVDACARAGLAGRWVAWDDPDVDWSSAAAVVRSTWDYPSRRPEFLAWADRVPRLLNPAAVIRWNSDKAYLRELAAAGVPVVPTRWVAPGESVDLAGLADIVVKPSVGAGSMGAGRFRLDADGGPDAVRAHIAHLHEAGRTVMVQPYLDQVDGAGETALVFIDGRFSHAIAKAAMLPEPVAYRVGERPPLEFFVTERITPRVPAPAELDLAAQALAARPSTDDLLYARVDMVPGPDGPVLMELELIEPSLFLDHAEAAPDRLAWAVAARLARP